MGPHHHPQRLSQREVNALGNRLQREGKPGYSCASNEANAAAHIWDMLDAEGHRGATACIIIPDFADAHPEEGGWRVLAEWIDEHLNYGSLHFFPKLWAVNVQWHETPKRRIDSHAPPKGQWRRNA